MAESGSILTKSGELSEVTNWYYEIDDSFPSRYKARFQLAWNNVAPPDVLAGAKLRLAGKTFIVWYIYQVSQWDRSEIEVYCYALAQEGAQDD